jgi:hypothetical protein
MSLAAYYSSRTPLSKTPNIRLRICVIETTSLILLLGRKENGREKEEL